MTDELEAVKQQEREAWSEVEATEKVHKEACARWNKLYERRNVLEHRAEIEREVENRLELMKQVSEGEAHE